MALEQEKLVHGNLAITQITPWVFRPRVSVPLPRSHSEAAAEYVARLKSDKRYQRDVY